MKRIFTHFIAALTLAVLVVVAGSAGHSLALASPGHGFADVQSSKTDVCEGVGLTGSKCGGNGTDLNGIIKSAIDILSVIVGLAAVIMIIISGFRYITSGGEANGIAAAKNTLIYAVVGLIIVALAQTIVHFVLAKV